MSAPRLPAGGFFLPENAILMLRHGAVRVKDGRRRYIGQTDLPLDETGRMQARWWAHHLKPVALQAIYCSDLSRSHQTAEIIGKGRTTPITALPALREIYLGTWEGLAFETVRTRFPDQYRCRGRDLTGYRPPGGGESFNDLLLRVVPAFEAIVGRHSGRVLIVGHAGANRVLLCHVLGMPLANLFRLSQDYGALNLMARAGTGFRAMAVNLPPGGCKHSQGTPSATLPGT